MQVWTVLCNKSLLPKKKQFFFDSYQKEQKKDHARRRILTRKLQLKLSKAFFVFFFF